ncbi:MAG: hypothetical protein IKS55_09990 [Oscillospiraceae bacterium]|nr:hypothetical protein [Oscillospiraceae bacterium]
MKPEPNEKAPVYIAAIVAVIMVFAAKSDEAMIIPAALTLVMVVVIAAISSALAKRKKKAAAKEAGRRENPLRDSYSAAGNRGEDYQEHDRNQRLQQLDEWLKSGLIDKKEYRELKKKYQNM